MRWMWGLPLLGLAPLALANVIPFPGPGRAPSGGGAPPATIYEQVLSGKTDNSIASVPTAGTCTYYYLSGAQAAGNGVRGAKEAPIPTSGVFSEFNAFLPADIGTSPDEATISLVSQGTSGSQSLGCTISYANADKTFCEAAGTMSVAQLDRVAVEVCVAAGATPCATCRPNWSVVWTPTTADEFIYLSGSQTNASGARYMMLGGATTDNQSEANARHILPFAATAKKLCGRLGGAITNGGSYALKLRDDGGDAGSMAVTLNSSNQEACDNSNTASVAANSLVNYSITPSSTPDNTPQSGYGVVLLPDTAGRFFLAQLTGSGGYPTATTRYFGLSTFGYAQTSLASASTRQVAFNVLAMYVGITTAGGSPGVGWTVGAYDGTSDQLAVTLNNTDTSGSDTGPYAVTEGTSLFIRLTINGTPGADSDASYAVIEAEREQP